MQKILILAVLTFSVCSFALKTLPKAPGLVVVLVYDQMRADYLQRYRDEMLPGKDKSGKVGGFRYLLDNGAWYPQAEHEVLQSMTCPGHAMILSGSYPYTNGISLNNWPTPGASKDTYCVDDDEYGVSPRRMHGDTVGDELKRQIPGSRVVSVSLKDRAAVMLGGKNPDLALWLNPAAMNWVTSKYYKNASLDWLQPWNQRLAGLKDSEVEWHPNSGKSFDYKFKLPSEQALGTPVGVRLTTDAVQQVVQHYKLGAGAKTDLLAISFSNHDFAGHHFGPDSAEMKDMTLQEDLELSRLLNFLQISVSGGLNNIWIVLTADHGVSPVASAEATSNLGGGEIDTHQLMEDWNQALQKKFGQPRDAKNWVRLHESLNFYMYDNAMPTDQVQRQAVVDFSKTWLEHQKGVAFVIDRWSIARGIVPPELVGRQALRSYVASVNGDFILIPQAFTYEHSHNLATHVTGYAYDRTVPLIFAGKAFQAGVYGEKAHVVDIASTLSFELNILPPALSEGRVLNEILK